MFVGTPEMYSKETVTCMKSYNTPSCQIFDYSMY